MEVKNYRFLIIFLVAILGIEVAFVVEELNQPATVTQVLPAKNLVATPVEVSPIVSAALGGGDQVPPEVEVAPEVKATAPAKPTPKSLEGHQLNIPVESWLALYVPPTGGEQLLTSNQPERTLPIASLTKLITAIVAKDNLDPNLIVSVTPDLEILNLSEASTTTAWPVKVGDLIYPLLVESNNNAADVLANTFGREAFIAKMNETAQELGMLNTHFVNPNGLDPIDGSEPNYSTAKALINLAQVYNNFYPDLLAITNQTRGTLYSTTGEVVRNFKNTNKLLGATDWPGAKVVGGKTGFTDQAGRLLLTVLETDNGGKIYTVVMKTRNHFLATRDMLNWIFYQYHF